MIRYELDYSNINSAGKLVSESMYNRNRASAELIRHTIFEWTDIEVFLQKLLSQFSPHLVIDKKHQLSIYDRIMNDTLIDYCEWSSRCLDSRDIERLVFFMNRVIYYFAEYSQYNIVSDGDAWNPLTGKTMTEFLADNPKYATKIRMGKLSKSQLKQYAFNTLLNTRLKQVIGRLEAYEQVTDFIYKRVAD